MVEKKPRDRLAGRNGQVWQAYLDGATQDALAERFNIDQSRVSRILAEVRATIPPPVIEDIAQAEADRIAALYAETMRIMRAHHPLVSIQRGTVVRDEETGERLTDDGPVLGAINTALKIHERIAKTYGLEAATKIESQAQVHYTYEGVNPEGV